MKKYLSPYAYRFSTWTPPTSSNPSAILLNKPDQPFTYEQFKVSHLNKQLVSNRPAGGLKCVQSGSRLHQEYIEETHYFYEMRIALLADIHGNSIALEAVMADITRKGGVDGYWILGDLVALGPDPIGVLEQLMHLPELRLIRGNTDRYVVSGDRPSPTLEEARENSNLLPPLVEVANTFAWTQGMITATGWLQWLKDLPVELRISLPDGSQFLGVHASPGRDDGLGISPEMNESDIQELFDACDANLVCMGHTHLPMERRWNGIHLVNPGAVSLSLTPNRNACYAVLEATNDDYSISHHEVPFDRQHVIDQLNHLGHPGRSFLIRHLSVQEQ